MRSKGLAAFVVAVFGAVGAFAVYTFGWHDSDSHEQAAKPRVITLRDGDVVVRPEAATKCRASSEGGFRNLFCTRFHGGRHQVVFYSDSVLVWPLDRGPDGPPVSYLWTPYVLKASRKRQTIGRLELRNRATAVTFEDATRVLGRPSCHPTGPAEATARWGSLGIRLELATRGALPSGKNGCEAPGAMYVHSAYVTGRRWQTERRLKVGLPATLIRKLYPHAIFQRRSKADRPGPAYWIVHVRQACIGVCRTRNVTVPRLSVVVRDGRVAGFFFPVYAEGE